MKRFDITGLCIVDHNTGRQDEIIMAKHEKEAKEEFIRRFGMEYVIVKCVELEEEK